LDFLTRPAQLTAMLSALPDGLRVVLGGESRLPPLLNSSVLLAHYLSGGTPAGTLGLIGPLRMDYAAAIPQLEYFAKTVGQLLAKLTEEYNNGE
ncbi:MAG: heat-inducible transcription repressor HrcA, partial [Oscillospiraceae bacterium]|nr:heat-inducible transcription repressor HrcA [Oscillospiraceae bacterium]